MMLHADKFGIENKKHFDFLSHNFHWAGFHSKSRMCCGHENFFHVPSPSWAALQTLHPPAFKFHRGSCSEAAKKSKSPWTEINAPQNPPASHCPAFCCSTEPAAYLLPCQSVWKFAAL